jgi:hypothetical protein
MYRKRAGVFSMAYFRWSFSALQETLPFTHRLNFSAQLDILDAETIGVWV